MVTWSLTIAALLGCPSTEEQRAQQFHRSMIDIEKDAAAMRDAVVKGDIHDARARAGQLVERVPTTVEPELASKLKLALSDVRGASSIEEAGAGVGRVMAVCAECHRTSGASIERPPKTKMVDPTDPVSAEMGRHAYVIDGLWLGIIGSSDDVLSAALDVIDAGPLRPDADVAWHTAALDARAHEQAQALRTASPEDRPELFGKLLATCGDCHQAGSRPKRPRIEGVALPVLDDVMSQHFMDALEIELGVMGGELDAAKKAAARLEAAEPDPRIPGTAAEYLAALRTAAGRVGAATTIREAAVATADLYQSCGRCHQAAGAGPTEKVGEVPTEQHMAVHLFGAYWMGYGLLAPDERAWLAGAKALESAKLAEDGWEPPAGLDRLDVTVHQLAQRAQVVTEPTERAAVWAELLTSCAPCHQQMRRESGK